MIKPNNQSIDGYRHRHYLKEYAIIIGFYDTVKFFSYIQSLTHFFKILVKEPQSLYLVSSIPFTISCVFEFH